MWTNLANVSVISPGNTIQKTGGAPATWDAGAVSTRAIASGDGYVQATFDVTNTYRMFGLSYGDSNQSFGDIDYAAYLAGSSLMVYERACACSLCSGMSSCSVCLTCGFIVGAASRSEMASAIPAATRASAAAARKAA